ncbi:MAG: D-2-hydroxyacid dehydrogenase [Acidimicrobiales bacterium]|nr:D-2-hydroxyacid dehydrogenase [Acidimicrobiales bacterium]MYA27116.1 D-2-hydroxyacid dehydrogenase [Acidimicrobiales bacterium]MYA81446.1 D-2-hydroxyacid dehydrogenase [Acidimicrobiales bacterium]MYD34731.1 D-2-hydroxyacid dehydrogenase [Acidimicrobiales bacterium]MYD83798.1 D-2-hydroxyacid dehydrogenase [Acidimicrobiales bacterium]
MSAQLPGPTVLEVPDGPLNVLVTKTLTLPDVSPDDEAAIRDAAGPGAVVNIVDRPRDGVPLAADAQVILGIVPQWLFDAAPKLRWIHATASGVDMFMYPRFLDSDVVLTGEKGLVGSHLADHAFGLLLALVRRIATAVKLGPDGWDNDLREQMRYSELELEGLTMGILGFGGTGRHIARRALAFGMRVQAMDLYPVPPGEGVETVGGPESLGDIVATSDVLAVGLPLTADTKGMFNDEMFASMPDGAILLNVTRGEIIDGPSLERALAEGRIGGAALDVAPVEPLPPDSPLWAFDNCVMTPHTAGASQHRARRNLERFCRNLIALREGRPLEGVVDKQTGF